MTTFPIRCLIVLVIFLALLSSTPSFAQLNLERRSPQKSSGETIPKSPRSKNSPKRNLEKKDEKKKVPGTRGTDGYWNFWAQPFLKAASGVQLVGFRQPLHILAAYNGTTKDFLIWGLPPEPKQPIVVQKIKEPLPTRGTKNYWKFWSESERRVPARHVQPLFLTDPMLIVTANGGSSYAPKLTREWLLTGVQARDDQAFPRKTDNREFNLAEKNEIKALVEAITNAAFTPEVQFSRSAEDNDYLNWGTIFENPSRYRGKVISMKGTLRRLRKLPAPHQLVHRGIPFVYEGWVFTNTYGANPVCVVLPRLPERVEVGEVIEHEVAFNGYFLKRYKYFSGKGWKRTLHFVAPTFEVRPKPQDAGLSDLITKVFMFLAVFGVITAVGLGIVRIWYLVHDAKVRKRISRAKDKLAVSQFEDEIIDPRAQSFAVTSNEPNVSASPENSTSGKSVLVERIPRGEHGPRFQFPDEEGKR
ncbi:MAG: hypothetical protein ACFCD0_15645 [Gemmataceae bacterium]